MPPLRQGGQGEWGACATGGRMSVAPTPRRARVRCDAARVHAATSEGTHDLLAAALAAHLVANHQTSSAPAIHSFGERATRQRDMPQPATAKARRAAYARYGNHHARRIEGRWMDAWAAPARAATNCTISSAVHAVCPWRIWQRRQRLRANGDTEHACAACLRAGVLPRASC